MAHPDPNHEIHIEFENENFDEVLNMLRKNPELANEQNFINRSIFWLACAKSEIELVNEMIRPPIKDVLDHDLRDIYGYDALDVAEKFNNKKVIELINPIFGVGVYPPKLTRRRRKPDESGSKPEEPGF